MPFTTSAATDRAEYNVIQCLRKRVSAASTLPATAVNVAGALTTQVTMGALPPGAVVIGGYIYLSTVFNSSGTVTLSVGTINSAGTTTASVWGSVMDVKTTAGLKVFDDLLTVAPAVTSFSDTADLTVILTFVQGAADSTAGTADVVLFFSPRPVI